MYRLQTEEPGAKVKIIYKFSDTKIFIVTSANFKGIYPFYLEMNEYCSNIAWLIPSK